MHYHCLCEDGPAQGREFWDYGPPVRVGLPHEGQILDYRLISKLENRYIYHYHAGSAEDLAGEQSE